MSRHSHYPYVTPVRCRPHPLLRALWATVIGVIAAVCLVYAGAWTLGAIDRIAAGAQVCKAPAP